MEKNDILFMQLYTCVIYLYLLLNFWYAKFCTQSPNRQTTVVHVLRVVSDIPILRPKFLDLVLRLYHLRPMRLHRTLLPDSYDCTHWLLMIIMHYYQQKVI